MLLTFEPPLITVTRENIIRICRQYSVDAVLPGYGFLSENVKFAKAITDASMVFAGPSAESIIEMGLKHRAREVAITANVPVVPGTDLLESEEKALAEAERLTYPVSGRLWPFNPEIDVPLTSYLLGNAQSNRWWWRHGSSDLPLAGRPSCRL